MYRPRARAKPMPVKAPSKALLRLHPGRTTVHQMGAAQRHADSCLASLGE